MKIAGIIVLLISTTGTGILFSELAKKRVSICHELIKLCDLLKIDIGYKNTPVTELLNDFKFKYLSFITVNNVKKKAPVFSPLSKDENGEISYFIYMLGKTDAETQRHLIDSFREYCVLLFEKYTKSYAKNSKLFISLGLFGGTVISLILL